MVRASGGTQPMDPAQPQPYPRRECSPIPRRPVEAMSAITPLVRLSFVCSQVRLRDEQILACAPLIVLPNRQPVLRPLRHDRIEPCADKQAALTARRDADKNAIADFVSRQTFAEFSITPTGSCPITSPVSPGNRRAECKSVPQIVVVSNDGFTAPYAARHFLDADLVWSVKNVSFHCVRRLVLLVRQRPVPTLLCSIPESRSPVASLRPALKGRPWRHLRTPELQRALHHHE